MNSKTNSDLHHDTENKASGDDGAVDKVISQVEKMPHDQRNLAISKLEMYSGPIPHPDILERYNQIDPGAGKLIIDNGVAESEHRRSIESKAIEYSRRDRQRRDWMGFVIALVIVFVGALLIYLGHTVTGSILSGVSALGVVGLFLDNGSNDNKKTNETNSKRPSKDEKENSEP